MIDIYEIIQKYKRISITLIVIVIIQTMIISTLVENSGEELTHGK